MRNNSNVLPAWESIAEEDGVFVVTGITTSSLRGDPNQGSFVVQELQPLCMESDAEADGVFGGLLRGACALFIRQFAHLLLKKHIRVAPKYIGNRDCRVASAWNIPGSSKFL